MSFHMVMVVARWVRAAAPLGWLSVSACLATPVENPINRVIQETDIRAAENEKNKVDILFMVDNSLSMEAMQAELSLHFQDFFKVFDELAAEQKYPDLHIGIVTSDYGAGHGPGKNCDASPGGQKGILQALEHRPV